MLTEKQIGLLLQLLDQQPFKGREVAREILQIGEELEKLKPEVSNAGKTGKNEDGL